MGGRREVGGGSRRDAPASALPTASSSALARRPRAEHPSIPGCAPLALAHRRCPPGRAWGVPGWGGGGDEGGGGDRGGCGQGPAGETKMSRETKRMEGVGKTCGLMLVGSPDPPRPHGVNPGGVGAGVPTFPVWDSCRLVTRPSHTRWGQAGLSQVVQAQTQLLLSITPPTAPTSPPCRGPNLPFGM